MIIETNSKKETWLLHHVSILLEESQKKSLSTLSCLSNRTGSLILISIHLFFITTCHTEHCLVIDDLPSFTYMVFYDM